MPRYLGWGVLSRSVPFDLYCYLRLFVPQVERCNLGFVSACMQVVVRQRVAEL